MGNICRSPMAQGILEHQLKLQNLDWEIDSAGTGGWHKGEAPDKRAVAEAKKNGIDISHQQARQIQLEDFQKFDHIFVMDTDNYNDVRNLTQNEEFKNKVQFLTEYLYPKRNVAVPDPYYNGRFSEAFELMDTAIEKLLAKLT